MSETHSNVTDSESPDILFEFLLAFRFSLLGQFSI